MEIVDEAAINQQETIAEATNDLFDYTKMRGRIESIIRDWNDELTKTSYRRNQREIDVDIDKLHTSGKLRPDETFIAIRVIDSTIKKEQPAYMQYLLQSRRLAIFYPVGEVSYDYSKVSNIEEQFTKGMSYSEWFIPYFKCLDGSQTHGWDFVAVELDETKPLNVGITHIGHENLLFDRKLKGSIQNAPVVLWKFELTSLMLKNFVTKFGFEAEEANKLLEKLTQANKEGELTECYRVYFKSDDIVYVAWYSKDCGEWLKKPAKLFLGRYRQEMIQQMVQPPPSVDPLTGMQMMSPPIPTLVPRWVEEDEKIYPFKPLIYALSEEPSIINAKGRCFLDGPKQEAQISLWSSFVNGSNRAANVYGSPATPSPDRTGLPKRIETKLEHGCLYDTPLNFWSTPFPDPGIIKAAQALDTQHQSETGQVAFSVINRKDTRKTAEEISTAKEQSTLLSSVQVSLFSAFLREVYTHAWSIVQSQVLTGRITNFMKNPQGQVDMESVAKTYDLRPAGDVDVIERQEKLQMRLSMWPVIANTPIATTFLMDILKEAFPNDYERYQQETMATMQQMQQQIMVLSNLVKQMAVDDKGQVKPEFAEVAPALQGLP